MKEVIIPLLVNSKLDNRIIRILLNKDFSISSFVMTNDKFLDVFNIRLEISRELETIIKGFEELMMNANSFKEDVRVNIITYLIDGKIHELTAYTDSSVYRLLGLIEWGE